MSREKIEDIEKKLIEEEMMWKIEKGWQRRCMCELIVYVRDVSGKERLGDVARDSRGWNPLSFVESSWFQCTRMRRRRRKKSIRARRRRAGSGDDGGGGVIDRGGRGGCGGCGGCGNCGRGEGIGLPWRCPIRLKISRATMQVFILTADNLSAPSCRIEWLDPLLSSGICGANLGQFLWCRGMIEVISAAGAGPCGDKLRSHTVWQARQLETRAGSVPKISNSIWFSLRKFDIWFWFSR